MYMHHDKKDFNSSLCSFQIRETEPEKNTLNCISTQLFPPLRIIVIIVNSRILHQLKVNSCIRATMSLFKRNREDFAKTFSDWAKVVWHIFRVSIFSRWTLCLVFANVICKKWRLLCQFIVKVSSLLAVAVFFLSHTILNRLGSGFFNWRLLKS